MHYRGSNYDWSKKETTHQVACYAESEDGIHWNKPELWLCDFEGSGRNNIVWMGPASHNFTPFKDSDPDCKAQARYKALGVDGSGLLPFQSPDGIHWSLIQDEPSPSGTTSEGRIWNFTEGGERASETS